MDVNQSIAKILEMIGVDHVFGGSGQVNASMLLALRDCPKMRTIVVRNEQAASFMACGYSMFSEKLGVCFATGGPGAFNLFSGMAVAYSDSLPILGITGYASARDRGKGALNESTGLSRTPDSHAMFSATTKKSFIIEQPGQTCDILEEAIYTAFEGRPGPVHIHVPKDVTVMPVDNFRAIDVHTKPVLPKPGDLERLAAPLIAALAAGKQTMLLLGYGCLRSHAQPELLSLIDLYQIPFATTMDAKGLLPENHPLSLGVFGTSGDPGANRWFGGCELVLAIGNSFAQNATFGFKPDLYQGKTLLHVNLDPAEIGKVYQPAVGLVSEARPAVAGLLRELAGKAAPAAPKQIARDKFYDQTVPPVPAGTVHPAALVKALSDNLPPDSIVLGDAGAHMLWLNCYLNLTRNQCYQNPGSFGPMASHTNAAIGIKCANPQRPVISGSGDGCFLMAGHELLTAVQYKIPVTWVIFRNGEFNIIKKFMLSMYGQECAMQFRNPDYVRYAEACGARGFRVERLEDFAASLQQALALNQAGEPALIDVAVANDVYPPFAMGKV